MFGKKETEAAAVETAAPKKRKKGAPPSPRNRHLITLDLARRTGLRMGEPVEGDALVDYWADLQPLELWRAAKREVTESLEKVDGKTAVADLTRWMGRNGGHPAIKAFSYVPYPLEGDGKAKLAISRLNRAIQRAIHPEYALRKRKTKLTAVDGGGE